jgi:hypothetical protein
MAIKMNISKHITYQESVKSVVAIKFGIDNIPNELQLKNMIELAKNVFEPLRAGLGGYPLIITSFFRSAKLNKTVGGAYNSQHKAIDGAAMDIDNDRTKDGPSNVAIFNYIKDNLEFDQLIWEYGDNDRPDWVHVSFNLNNNRRQLLRCIGGQYKKIEL